MKKSLAFLSAIVLALCPSGCAPKDPASAPETKENRIEMVQEDPSIPPGVKEDVIRRIQEEEAGK